MVGEVIYLDNAASMPMCEQARSAMLEVIARGLDAANPSSPHRPGQSVRRLIDESRETAAELLGASPGEILFTSGGTESANLGLIGAARAMRREQGRHGVVVSSIEHHAVLEAAAHLEEEGFAVERAACDGRGVVTPDTVAYALDRLAARGARPAVVAVMLANNEVGTLQPVAQIAEVARRAGALMLTDAVQGPFCEDLDVRRLGCQVMALSAHKFGGPKGAGLLYVERGVPFDPILFGGGQERMLRPGTENVAGIAGMAAALSWARQSREAIEAHKRALEERLLSRLFREVAGLEVNGAGAPRVPGLVSLYVPGVEAETLLVELDMNGVACSYGAACTAGSLVPSHVLRAMGLPEGRVRSSIRVSIGPFNTPDEINEASERIAGAVRRLREAGDRAAAAGVNKL